MKTAAPKCITLDFETEAIQQRPAYPPRPVGLAVRLPGKRGEYLAWGHPTGNNCSRAQARERLAEIYRSGVPLLFQNAKFDLDVAETHLNLKLPGWERVHDTLYQIFLHDPHAPTLSLKPSAERILGVKPEEQDLLKAWVIDNVPEARRKPSSWGAYICRAPGALVGRYAVGDVDRTLALHKYLWPSNNARGMTSAYDRERQLMPILLRNEREGIRVDLPALERDLERFTAAREYADRWLRKTLRAPELNVDSDAEFAEALFKAGVVTDFARTPTGKRSVSKKNLTRGMFNNERVYRVFSYRNRINTALSMFIEPWITMAAANGGRVAPTWNQVRGEGGGARTGRPSTENPNLLNVPKPFGKKDPDYKHPDFLRQLPPLPVVRGYMLPDTDKAIWGRRDFNQQELRGMAHFEDGDLCRRYNANPRFDLHTLVQQGVKSIAGITLDRDAAKIVNFQDIYGGGVTALCLGLGVSRSVAEQIKAAKRALMPDFAGLVENIKECARTGQPIVTWGGRQYYSEGRKYIKSLGREVDFAYKLINYLIQGSCADITKEALIRYDALPQRRSRFLIYVYDEIDISIPDARLVKREMALLRDVMEDVKRFDVPMLSDGETGPNWAALTKFTEPEYQKRKED